MQRTLIALGLLLLALGLLWPWLPRLGLGRLPGDIRIERENLVVYAPLGSALLISILVSAILFLLRR